MSVEKQRTPTDVLIAAMEEADKAEECMVIMTSSDGSIITLNSSIKISTKLGLLEMAKTLIVTDIVRGKNEP